MLRRMPRPRPAVNILSHAPVRVTLVTGACTAARETAIAAALMSVASAPAAAPLVGCTVALILEGLPSGQSEHAAMLDPHHNPLLVQAARIAPGCLCCIGNLTLKVTLNRILRHPPQRLYISLASATHIGQLRAFLSSPPYDTLLRLTDDLQTD